MRASEGRTPVLIVHDNPDNLRILTEILESRNYIIRVALDGTQALENVHAVPPHLILLDIQMPRMDGYKTCRRLQTDDEHTYIPVIFISSISKNFNKGGGIQGGGRRLHCEASPDPRGAQAGEWALASSGGY